MENSRLAGDIERLAESLGNLPEPTARPALIAVSGLPGTGKSYLSARLAERFDVVVLESDALRKLLFPSPVYSAEESTYLFRVIHGLIERLLQQGVSLILDATNLSESNREHLYSIAEQAEAKLLLVGVKAPPELVRSRLESRHSHQSKNEQNKSDADWAVYQRMKSGVEEIHRRHYSVDTSRDISPVIDKIVKEVMR